MSPFGKYMYCKYELGACKSSSTLKCDHAPFHGFFNPHVFAQAVRKQDPWPHIMT